MRVSDVLRNKGNTVQTVQPGATVRELLGALAEHNIGAAVVSADGQTIVGIVSERDVVRQLHQRGADLLEVTVADIMTADVRTSTPEEALDDLRATMTKHRIRHVPVVQDGRIAGLVSIGDVVKSTISELETEREHLVGYIQS
jgi:CBS domain-containing protein